MTTVNKLTLVSRNETTDAIGQIVVTETTKDLFCEVRSVSQSEFIQGRQAGLDPAYVFIVSRFGYNGEQTVIYNGEYLSIERTYMRDENEIELHCGREIGVTNVKRSS